MNQILHSCFDFLEEYNDSMMLLTTVVYVIATIFICVANFKSATASRNQLEESKREFKESKRLELMPYLHLSVDEDTDMAWNSDYNITLSGGNSQKHCTEKTPSPEKIVVRNIGLGNAKEISLSWKKPEGTIKKENLPFSTLMVGETKKIAVFFWIEHSEKESVHEEANLIYNYSDLLNNHYEQVLTVTFEVKGPGEVKIKQNISGSPILK